MQERERRIGRTLRLGAAIVAALLLVAPGSSRAQPAAELDICGCAGSPDSLGDFNSNDDSTWPEGTIFVGSSTCNPVFRIPAPPDGVLVFDSFTIDRSTDVGCGVRTTVEFIFLRNQANTPITLLVKGNFFLGSGDALTVSGGSGSNGTTGAAGVGGNGGAGGFAGGDGAYQVSNGAADGGAGVGPGGGLGSVAAGRVFAEGGTFVGVPELRPLVGGSGGGGGHSSSGSTGCAGGGGGGGGGALLIAANGTMTIAGQIRADGGNGGVRANSSCSSYGGGGSGGAIRLLANRITGSGRVYARGGAGAGGGSGAESGRDGSIRMEAISNGFTVNGTDPVASRQPAPGPLVNPITPVVEITGIDGAATPLTPIGHLGRIDMVVDAPGLVQVDLATRDVPAGTDLAVTVKPKVGAPPIEERVTLDPGACSGGDCVAAVGVDLGPGAYIVEARATFETP